tara:strand:- start:107 stop:373 length:267 start_codon:yes stop_codon:yes gene_type:complete
MAQLPSLKTPLNQHSLEALELWLKQLGATRSKSDPCLWHWIMPDWVAEIQMDYENLRIRWEKDGSKCECSFSYRLSREDVQSAIYEGP